MYLRSLKIKSQRYTPITFQSERLLKFSISFILVLVFFSVLSHLLCVNTSELTLQAAAGYSAGPGEKLFQAVVSYFSEVIVTFQDDKE